MKQFAIMCTVSFETEVYVDAENLPEAMEKLTRGEEVFADPEFCSTWAEEAGVNVKYTALDFIKSQVWDDEKGDYVPCNVIMFPVKEEIADFDLED